MDNKPRVLLISGSPRHGNTHFILSKIYDSIETDQKELIILNERNIKFCRGCLFCHTRSKCSIKDEMEEILEKMINSDVFIIGTPNYFDNVSGLTKNFIDRCHPLYKDELVKDKKLVLVYVGGGKSSGTKGYLDQAFSGFVKYLKLKLIGSYSFQALNPRDLCEEDISKEVEEIVQKVNSIY